MFVEPDTIAAVQNSTPSGELVGGKRKRRSEEGEMAAKVAKKQRAIPPEVNPQRAKRGSRMRRAQRSKPEEEQKDNTKPSCKSEEDPVTIILDEDTEKRGWNQLLYVFYSLQLFELSLLNLLDAQLLIIN